MKPFNGPSRWILVNHGMVVCAKQNQIRVPVSFGYGEDALTTRAIFLLSDYMAVLANKYIFGWNAIRSCKGDLLPALRATARSLAQNLHILLWNGYSLPLS
jgi:hypothetical protein